jgi:hypothetical protein
MAAREVIHFQSRVQLTPRPSIPAQIPPDPVAESPPSLKTQLVHCATGHVSGLSPSQP